MNEPTDGELKRKKSRAEVVDSGPHSAAAVPLPLPPGQGAKDELRLRRNSFRQEQTQNCDGGFFSPAGCRTVTQVCRDLGIRQADQRATVGMPVSKDRRARKKHSRAIKNDFLPTYFPQQRD